VEDLLMRNKKSYSLYESATICKIYGDINMGTNLFWQEIEELMIVQSAKFKELNDLKVGGNSADALIWVI